MELTDVLKKLMLALGLSVAELARNSNVARQALSNILSGKTKKPHNKTIKKLAEYFGITPAQLMGDEDFFPDVSGVESFMEKLHYPESTKASVLFSTALMAEYTASGFGDGLTGSRQGLFEKYIKDGVLEIEIGNPQDYGEKGADIVYGFLAFIETVSYARRALVWWVERRGKNRGGTPGKEPDGR